MMYLPNLLPWFWLIVLIVCCIIEAITMGLTTIWAAIAALPMIFIARTGLGFQWQLLIFVVVTLVLVFGTRPLVLKKLRPGRTKTNINTMIGEEVLVTKEISKFQKGEAKARNGVIWTVQAMQEDQQISKGTVCSVEAVEGNTLIIKPTEKKE